MQPWFIRNDHPDFSQKKSSRPLPVKNLCPSSRRPDLFIGGAGRVVLSCPSFALPACEIPSSGFKAVNSGGP